MATLGDEWNWDHGLLREMAGHAKDVMKGPIFPKHIIDWTTSLAMQKLKCIAQEFEGEKKSARDVANDAELTAQKQGYRTESRCSPLQVAQ